MSSGISRARSFASNGRRTRGWPKPVVLRKNRPSGTLQESEYREAVENQTTENI